MLATTFSLFSGVPPCGFLFKLQYIVVEEGSFSLLIWIAECIYRNGYGSYFLIIPKSLIRVVVNCELTPTQDKITDKTKSSS